MNNFQVFQIGPQRNGEYRFIIAPLRLEDEIATSLPDGDFIDSYSTLDGVLGGITEIRLGNELLRSCAPLR
jgi:hypothetical protein